MQQRLGRLSAMVALIGILWLLSYGFRPAEAVVLYARNEP